MAPTARTDVEQTVLDFMAAWADGDADRLMSYFAPDARFHNAANPGLEISELVGHVAIREYLEHLCSTQETEIEVRRIASDGSGTVFAERLDRVHQREAGRDPFMLPVVGVLTIRDGKIVEWGEYFDARVAEAGLGFDPYAGERG
jgi:limonene-1,2-epoxide hydrolase